MAMEPLPLGYGDAMDAALFSSLWTFQDQVVQPQETVEELKQSLLTATVELEASKEELRRRDQTIAKLADLVRQVAKERDEALDRAQQLALLVKQQAAAAAHAHTSPPAQAALVTSSVTDSDCSLVSSPVDPFFDPVTSSDRRRCGKLSPPPPPAKPPQQKCGADAVLDMLAGKRPLPPRGRFLQSVMEAGPLLQNLLVAGPLPRWRNPPPVHALDAAPVGAAPVCGGVYLSAANALGHAPNADPCMKRPMANCSPGFGAKRHRLH
uniref:Uncharacterized protein n=1 Tax=Avena sativa TaxID=4498 RepID=A0ACD5W5B4_AVESA